MYHTVQAILLNTILSYSCFKILPHMTSLTLSKSLLPLCWLFFYAFTFLHLPYQFSSILLETLPLLAMKCWSEPTICSQFVKKELGIAEQNWMDMADYIKFLIYRKIRKLQFFFPLCMYFILHHPEAVSIIQRYLLIPLESKSPTTTLAYCPKLTPMI